MTRSVWRERDELTGEPRVVKRFDGSRAWRAHKEAEVMRSLEATGWGGRIPTAIDTHVVDDHDTTLLVMTVLPGTPLALTTGAAQWLDSLRAIGSLLAELHASASVSAHGRPGAVAEGFAPQRFGWLADELAQHGAFGLACDVRTAGEHAPHTPLVFCHGDLHLENTLVLAGPSRPVLGMVDFEAACFAPAEYDVAASLVTTSALDVQGTRAILEGYGRRLSRERLDRFVLLHAATGWLFAAEREGRDQDLWRQRLRDARHRFAASASRG